MDIKLFTPYPLQREFIDEFIESDPMFGVVVAPRGSGKTLMGMNIMLYWLLQKKNQKGGWISPVYNQAKSVYDQIVVASKEVIIQNNRQDLNITFVNGSTLKFLSTDNPDNIRGFRFTHIVIDEIAFQRERAIDQVVLPTLNPNGKKCLMISTPKGRNHFFNWYNKTDVIKKKFPLTECPYVNQDLIDAAKASLPPDLFRQEFLAEFVDSANDVFVGVDKVAFVGEYRTGGDAFIGIDTGLQDDMSVLTLMSPIGRVLNVVSINNKPINDVAETFIQTMLQYNVVGGYIETNGIGRAMYDLVQPRFKKVREFFTTQDNKTEMVRKLINDIETSTVELPSIDLCPELHTEFSTYTYKLSPTGKLSFSHIPGGHDDYVDSLMLANYSRVQFMTKRPITITNVKNVRPTFGSTSPR